MRMLCLCCATALCTAAGALETLALDDFEGEPAGWKYVGGEEFPGARGGMSVDDAVAHSGRRALRLEADFAGGGAYVGLWRELSEVVARDTAEIRCWVRAEHVERIGVRLSDGTGQCHQAKNIALKPTGEWQELVLALADLVGEEHWVGANDGAWHAPLTAFGLNIGSDGLGGATSGTLWIDDLRLVIEPPGVPTLLACELSQPAARPGYGLRITYRWQAEPMGRDYEVFVHLDGPGGMMLQHDHHPPVPTSRWSGPVEYTNTFVCPTDAPPGEYKIHVGLWHRPTGERAELRLGDGVADGGGRQYEAGRMAIAETAPIPPLPAPSLDLDGFRVTFDEDFDGPLDVSAWGPGTRWIAHTPYAGDFGDARFGDPGPNSPFAVRDGILTITARKIDGRWQAGLLSSVDKNGDGFCQQYGYFEMRAKLPPGRGTWPAFWLLGQPRLLDDKIDQIEIDVVEQYGVGPNALHTTIHHWNGDGTHTGEGAPHIVEGMTTGFHRYGVMVDEQHITFYYDGVELWRRDTPEIARVPLYLLVNLAIGGGWPIDELPDPSVMEVDYVRVWQRGGGEG